MAKNPKVTAFTAKISTPEISVDDFCRYLPQRDAYFFIPCRDLWPGSSVNARLSPVPVLTKTGKPKKDADGNPMVLRPTIWISRHRKVEQTTWAPGLPLLIPNRLCVAGGWIEREGTQCFNLYRPPQLELGDSSKAQPWIDHVHRVLNPDDAEHTIDYLSQRVQQPQVKPNHALVLGGEQGIGKDSLLEPLKPAVGQWNFHDISPSQLLGAFNSFAKAVILRINEGRDLGSIDRFKFYDHAKIYTAAPPDVLRVNEKHLKESTSSIAAA
jgi:hypothetical protein